MFPDSLPQASASTPSRPGPSRSCPRISRRPPAPWLRDRVVHDSPRHRHVM